MSLIRHLKLVGYVLIAPFVLVAVGVFCIVSGLALFPYLLLHDFETGPH